MEQGPSIYFRFHGLWPYWTFLVIFQVSILSSKFGHLVVPQIYIIFLPSQTTILYSTNFQKNCLTLFLFQFFVWLVHTIYKIFKKITLNQWVPITAPGTTSALKKIKFIIILRSKVGLFFKIWKIYYSLLIFTFRLKLSW
jgi:hypothetical protein